MKGPLLRVRLDAGYRKQAVLRDVCFDLWAGERIGLLGSSGAGKSTLLLALLGLLSYRGGWARGEVLFAGKNLLELPRGEARHLRGREFALVPQSPMSALNAAISVQAHFQAAWVAHRRPDKQALSSRIAELTDRVGLPSGNEFLLRKPGQISVGQAQRCAIALALLHLPSLIIADEPTSALDPVTQTEVLDLLREVSEEGQTALLFVSHDLLSVFRLCSEILSLSKGQLSERVPLVDLPYTRDPELRALLSALPLPADVLLKHMRSKTAEFSEQASRDPQLALSQ